MKQTESNGIKRVFGLVKRDHWDDEGAWDDEPDRVEWKSESGLACLTLRGPMGSWCGYVAVPEGHPLHGKDYSAAEDIDVHGGLTFSRSCDSIPADAPQENIERFAAFRKLSEATLETVKLGSICHAVAGKDNVWWFGFDCAHFNDKWPYNIYKATGTKRDKILDDLEEKIGKYEETHPELVPRYRTVTYVMSECEDLARQLVSVA